jgi:hypothetical protein
MKAFGTYIDTSGCSCAVHFSEREAQVKWLAEELLRETERAFAEDAQMGIFVGKILS